MTPPRPRRILFDIADELRADPALSAYRDQTARRLKQLATELCNQLSRHGITTRQAVATAVLMLGATATPLALRNWLDAGHGKPLADRVIARLEALESRRQAERISEIEEARREVERSLERLGVMLGNGAREELASVRERVNAVVEGEVARFTGTAQETTARRTRSARIDRR